jgi:ribosomal peptide maturation radical SAM protein 1
MGEEIIAKTGWIDIVATSEADDLLIPLCRRLLAGEEADDLQGIARRTATGEIRSLPRTHPVSAELLEALPDPDYDDYITGFESLDAVDAAALREKTALLFEGSRGCWWGEKNHCTFCGLNSTGLTFRSKSPARVRDLLNNLARKYPVRRLAASDNCMPIDFFKGLWPEFVGSDFSRNRLVFYEVKPNLGRSELRLLSEAGVRYLQPGVETLSTNLLKCMRKGFTGLTHVYFLKLCRLFGIWPFWYFLVGIPGERREDYRHIISLLPLIRHFTPPRSGISPLQLHRFSPYYNETERYLNSFSPNPWYSEIYPAGRVDLNRVAYFFIAEWKNTLGIHSVEYQELDEQVLNWVESWVESPQLPKLTYDFLSTERLDLVDNRFGTQGLWSLDARESAVYRAIDDPQTPETIVQSTAAGSVGEVRSVLNDFVQAGLAIEEGGRYLGLALPDSTPDFPMKERKDLLLMQRINRQRLHRNKPEGSPSEALQRQ